MDGLRKAVVRAAARAPWLAPASLLAAGAVASVYGPRPHFGEPLLACTPLLAIMVLSFGWSVFFAVMTCLTAVGVAFAQDLSTAVWATDGLAVLLVSIVGLGLKRLSDAQGRSLAFVRDVAEAAQRAVLPTPPAAVGPLRAADRYVTARAGTAVGGDFYALQETPFGVRAIIGDVRGKGLEAVASVSVAVGAFREAAQHVPTLPELAAHLDGVLVRENERRGRSVESLEDFATALLLQFSHDADSLLLHNRGHTPPYLLGRGYVTPLEPTRPDLPLATGLAPGGHAHTDRVALRTGEALLLVTDGVTEARNTAGTFFDPRRGLSGTVPSAPRTLADTLVDRVLEWTGGERQDDMAILVVARRQDGGREGAAPASAPPREEVVHDREA
ncbi:PP2C family protein-serine/threonine phosphatase [Streptomyces xiaopingdaonensis]|uniref:PP2C family protein-serine/threonine phosphatase n=1 Tax=Streptomyces xiaopingdaonensis TaxID=1565415 RepID=UPI0002D8B87A|nr:PP2C family protein-serine/threonine phosphatase [Streptomyces xiaopingdaonensis]